MDEIRLYTAYIRIDCVLRIPYGIDDLLIYTSRIICQDFVTNCLAPFDLPRNLPCHDRRAGVRLVLDPGVSGNRKAIAVGLRRLTDSARLARIPGSLNVWVVMLTIGLTGGIGSGKSAVADLLRQLGASVIDADRLGHEAYTPNSEAWQQVVAAFGKEILTAEGEIDRRKLGSIVFADPAELARLNGIMHPLMARMVEERKADLAAAGESVTVVEAAVLFEAGWDSLVDEVWTAYAPFERVVERLYARNGLSEEEARKRINSQMSVEERNRRSDVVVDNSSDLAALEAEVRGLWRARVKGQVNQSNG